MVDTQLLQDMGAQQLRELTHALIEQIAQRDRAIVTRDQIIVERDATIARKDQDILYRQAKIDQLTHEMAVLKRWKFVSAPRTPICQGVVFAGKSGRRIFQGSSASTASTELAAGRSHSTRRNQA